MKKFALILVWLLLLTVLVCAQTSTPAAVIRFGPTLPSTCNPSGPNVFFKTSATIGLNHCTAVNTWTAVGAGGGSGTVTTVSVVTNQGVSGSVANPTTTPAITLSLAQINPLGVEMIGTAGAAHVYFPAQASINTVTSPGFALTSDSTNRPVWATNGKSDVTFDFLNVTGARVITFPDASITVARTDAAQTFTGVQTMTTPNFVTGFTVGGAATSRKVLVGNGTNFIPSTETYAVPGTSGNVLTSDGTNWTSAAPAAAGANTALSNLASVAINTDLLPASTQGLGNASFPFLASFTGNTTQYESVVQTAGVITHSALGSASNIDLNLTPKGNGNIQLGLATAGTGAGLLRFGGSSASFPALGYTGALLKVLAATGSAFANLKVNALELGNLTTTNATYISWNTATFGEVAGETSTLNSGQTLYLPMRTSTLRLFGVANITSDTAMTRNAAGVVEINNGTAGQWGSLFAGVRDAGTTTVTNGLTLGHQSTGTPAAGLGIGVQFNLNSTTTADQSAAQIAAAWSDATHATRTGDIVFSNVLSAAALAETFRVKANALIVQPQTITAGGTTGNQTINKPAGTVNIAAAGTAVTVTNSLVTTSSTIHCMIRTNDATARIANVVPAAGSFVINLTAAATAEISIGFWVLN